MKRTLSEQEVDIVVNYIKQQGIVEQATIDELADHLCTAIEAEFDITSDFNKALQSAAKIFRQKDLLTITENKQSFYAHPRFLNKSFLIALCLFSLLALLVGVYLKVNLLPGRRIVQIIGGISFAYFFLPLLLLYCLTEFANKAKYLLQFMILFAGCHAIFSYAYHWPIAPALLGICVCLTILYTVIHVVNPKLKSSK
jgi:hypothetical protein